MTRGGPVLARNDEAGDRFYTWQGQSYWSVTTIISGGVPKFLHAHYAKMAAELALAEVTAKGPSSRASAIVRRAARAGRAYIEGRQAEGALTSIDLRKLTDSDLALRWWKGAAERHRDTAAARGSDVHAEAEDLVLEHARESVALIVEGLAIRPWPAELAAYEASFLAFLADWQPEFLAAEATVFNRVEAYGGTLDSIWRSDRLARMVPSLEGVPVVCDLKSGRDVYPDVGLQLAPYARGEFIGAKDGATELPMPAVDLRVGLVLHLLAKPDRTGRRYRLRLVRIDEPIWDAFRFAREVYRFQKDLAGTVFLQDLTPAPMPSEEAAS